MKRKTYSRSRAQEILFPLGGIGTGCIGLAGNGRLKDWEVQNRPNKRSYNGYSHIAVKAESAGKVVDARVLQGDLQPGYVGEPIRGNEVYSGYGYGPDIASLAGLPHFEKSTFSAAFPFAELHFQDARFPGQVELVAFNPFIPLNAEDSSLPCAFFEIKLTNTTNENLDYTVCFSVGNPAPMEKVQNIFRSETGHQLLKLGSEQFAADDPSFGDLCIATDSADVSYQEFWYRGSWWDNIEVFWRDFSAAGTLGNRSYGIHDKPAARYKDMASLACHIMLEPGRTRTARFLVSWSFPNVSNHWNPPAGDGPNPTWKNHYATVFPDSVASAKYGLSHWERLKNESMKFSKAIHGATLPDSVLDAVVSNLAVLKTPTTLRLSDGSFYGFEGCAEAVGSCEGSCTHVWNYAYALPFLFPALERSMRDLDFRYNQRDDGRMSFRLMLPLGRPRNDFRACADGQFGGVLKAYRDWKICGDTEWLRKIWPAVKKSIEFAWAGSNEDGWDADKDGVLEGRQHHTLDMELFGPNSWLNGFYLGALKAGAEMAQHLGDLRAAAEFADLFARGKQWTDKCLFNGEYYQQRVDLTDRTLLDRYASGVSVFGDDVHAAYWNPESGQIKYQIGDGCEIDQVNAQWHANLSGLGEIFDPENTRSALRSIFKYNFFPSMRAVPNTARVFSLNDEAGVVICTWPERHQRPAVPLTYSTETQSGYEYQVAAQLVQNGLVDEGIRIVKAIRDRYDGKKRNPWSEIECGSNYARSMASYSLLLAFSGFTFNMVDKSIGFTPAVDAGSAYKTFWSLDSGWGTFVCTDRKLELSVLHGSLTLTRITLPVTSAQTIKRASVSRSTIKFARHGSLIQFEQTVTIRSGELLTFRLG